MRQEKKVKLNELQVQSFVTTLNRDEQEAIKGGGPDAAPGTTNIRILC